MYPDPAQVALRAAIAHRHAADGVTAEHVVAGAGCDGAYALLLCANLNCSLYFKNHALHTDIMDIALRMVCPKAIVISTPTFGMYAFLGQITNTKVEPALIIMDGFDSAANQITFFGETVSSS